MSCAVFRGVGMGVRHLALSRRAPLQEIRVGCGSIPRRVGPACVCVLCPVEGRTCPRLGRHRACGHCASALVSVRVCVELARLRDRRGD